MSLASSCSVDQCELSKNYRKNYSQVHSMDHSKGLKIDQPNHKLKDLNIKPIKRSIETKLVNLPLEDILIEHILPLLSIDDLFNLKLVSSFFDRTIDFYFCKLKKLNLSKSKWLTYQQINLILRLNHHLITQLDLSYNLSLNNHFLTRYLIIYRFNQLNSIKLNEVHWICPRVFSILILALGKQLEVMELAGNILSFYQKVIL